MENSGTLADKQSATLADKQTGWRKLLQPAVLDRIEQGLIVVLWAFLVRRVYVSENPFAPLLLLAETAVLIFVLIRRPTNDISRDSGDWMLAVTATAAPLLVMPVANPSPQFVLIGVALVLLGNIFQLWAKLFLRRSFGIAPANRGVKVEGPYRFVRHPMYAGYLAVNIGIMILMPSLFNLMVYAIAWSAQILRLKAEERLLSEDQAYREFKEKVRWRLVPGVF